MAKAFLAEILSTQNSITSERSQDCVICLERCGTLSSETGIMELEVRLPCSHIVGSACIATWLASNNTCPLCRHEFFPRQPRPYMEHEIMQDTGEDESQDSGDEEAIQSQRLPGESDEDFVNRLLSNSESPDGPSALALFYSLPLYLPLPIAFLALNVAHTADNLPVLENSSVTSVAAASVYIASHILNQPRDLADIARLTGVSERAIHIVYRAIYRDRYELIDESWCQRVGGTTVGEAAEALPSLTWPPLQYQSTTGSDGDDEESTEADNDSRQSGLGSLELVRELCFEFHGDDVNALNPSIRTCRMAESIAVRMNSMSLDWRTENPWTIAAACTYMASHLVSQRRTVEQVAVLSGVPSDWIRNTYQVMYRAREQIVQQDWYGNYELERQNAIYNLPGH